MPSRDPIQVLVGIPALVWGTHMRARRRQGWWVCAFGTAATVSVAGILVNPATGWLEAGLIIVYSLLPGLVLGYLLIRVDLLFTGPRGRRARREEEATAIRPEPARLQAAALSPAWHLAEGAGFEPAADISASDRFQGGSDRPLRHPSERPPGRPRRAVYGWLAGRLLRAAELDLHRVVREVVELLQVVGDVGEQPLQVHPHLLHLG